MGMEGRGQSSNVLLSRRDGKGRREGGKEGEKEGRKGGREKKKEENHKEKKRGKKETSSIISYPSFRSTLSLAFA